MATTFDELLERLETNDPNTTHCEWSSSSALNNDEERVGLATALSNNSFVASISFKNVVVDEDLLRAITSLKGLSHLTLEHAHLTLSTTRSLCSSSSIVPSSVLETLDLSHNPKIGPRGCKLLAEFVSNAPRLQYLNLADIGMGHYGAQALARGFLPSSSCSSSLRHLNLSHNQMGHDGLWKLAENFPVWLRSLDLSHNKCLDDGCLEVAKHLPSWKTLKVLNLAGNDIGDTGIESLAKSLCGSTVEELYLQENRIEDEGAKALAGYALSSMAVSDDSEESDDDDEEEECASQDDSVLLPPVSSLCLMDLSSNRIASAGCSALAQALSRGRHTLSALNLSKNEIGDEGAGSFVELLDDISTLQSLNLSENHFSSARIHILDMLLKHRTPTTRHSGKDESGHDVSEQSINTQKTDRGDDSTSKSAQDDSFLEDAEDVHDFDKTRELLQAALMSGSEDGPKELPWAYSSYLTDHFQSQSLLTQGAFGPLYSCRHHCQGVNLIGRMMTLGPSGPLQAVRKSVLTELLQLHHDTILPFVAYSHQIRPPGIEGASVSSHSLLFLYNVGSKRPLADLLRDKESRQKLTWSRRVHVLYNIARALEYLHSNAAGHKAMFHGDVTLQNVWITADDFSSIQLMDAGQSRLLATDRSRFANSGQDVVFGSRSYRCPRYERGSCPYDAASDMFSFGIVVGELVTGKLQLSKSVSGLAWDIYYDVFLTRQPLKPDTLVSSIPKKELDLVCQGILSPCLLPIVSKRPAASDLVQLLRPHV